MSSTKSQIEVVTVYAASGANVDQAFKDDAYDLGKVSPLARIVCIYLPNSKYKHLTVVAVGVWE